MLIHDLITENVVSNIDKQHCFIKHYKRKLIFKHILYSTDQMKK